MKKTLTLKKAVSILARHNSWRRGSDIPIEDATMLGVAIDVILKEIRKNIL